jgi:hypothetical protein
VCPQKPDKKIVSRYRSLPDAQRRELTATFKRERARNPKLDWTEFLAARFTLTASKLAPM